MGRPAHRKAWRSPSAVWATAGVAWQAAPWAEHIRAARRGRHVRGGGLPLLWGEYPWSTLLWTRSYVQERFDTVGQALHTGMTRSANLHVRPLARLKHARVPLCCCCSCCSCCCCCGGGGGEASDGRRRSLGLRSRGQPHPTTRPQCDGPLWQRQALRELEVDLMERQLDVSHTVRDVSKAQRLVVTTLYAHARHQPPSLLQSNARACSGVDATAAAAACPTPAGVLKVPHVSTQSIHGCEYSAAAARRLRFGKMCARLCVGFRCHGVAKAAVRSLRLHHASRVLCAHRGCVGGRCSSMAKRRSRWRRGSIVFV